MLDPETAKAELRSKTLKDIEHATAVTWGSRAAASYALAAENKDPRRRQERFWDGENYRQEALEHAAMTEDFGFAAELMREIDAHRDKARSALGVPDVKAPGRRHRRPVKA